MQSEVSGKMQHTRADPAKGWGSKVPVVQKPAHTPENQGPQGARAPNTDCAQPFRSPPSLLGLKNVSAGSHDSGTSCPAPDKKETGLWESVMMGKEGNKR